MLKNYSNKKNENVFFLTLIQIDQSNIYKFSKSSILRRVDFLNELNYECPNQLISQKYSNDLS